MPFHVMLIPTLGCPSKCNYCWSSDAGSPIMDLDTVKKTVLWLRKFRKDDVTFTFHGGEPLLAGAGFYKKALPMIAKGLSDRNVAFAMQTNLWLMTPEMAKVLAKYSIPIGSSLDGPKEINDMQRGKGYYERTLKGARIARENGLDVKFICTFTSRSIGYKEAIFDYFLENGGTLKLHPALPSLKSDDPGEWALDPKEYGELLVYLLDRYLENWGRVEVMNIDHLCKGVFMRRGVVCTFVDCVGDTFAVGPDGNIYPCYRFVGMPDFVMGNVSDGPAMDDLMRSKAGKLMEGYRKSVDKNCRSCAHIRYCRGGCPYNAIVPTSGKIKGVDPHCVAYKRIFDEIIARQGQEMFGSVHIETAMAGFDPVSVGGPGVMQIMIKRI